MDITMIVMDVSIMGAFLLAGTLLRSKLRFFQRFVIPAAVIGGILGWTVGPNGLNWIPVSDHLVQYAAALLNVVFAGIFLGRKIPPFGDIFKNAGAQYGFAVFNGFSQLAIGLLTVSFFGILGYSLHASFGLLLLAGFQGGPGIPTALGPFFTKLGWDATQAAAVGETCAIVGMLLSILVGVVLVNMGVTRKFSVRASRHSDRTLESPTFLPEENQRGIGREITNPEALGSLGYNFCFMGLSIIFGYLLHQLVISTIPMLKFIPIFPFVLVASMLVQLFMQTVRLDSYVDNATVSLISSFALDFLIVASLMALQLKVVLTYGLPLIFMLLLGIAFNVWWAMWLAPRTLPGAWFEKSLCEFGQATGATPQALLLLRMVDPELKSGAADPFALKLFFFLPTINILPLALAPLIVQKGAALFLGVFAVSAILILLIFRVFGWQQRPGVKWFGK